MAAVGSRRAASRGGCRMPKWFGDQLGEGADLGEDERLRGAVQVDRDGDPAALRQQRGDQLGGLDLLAEVDVGADDLGRREAGEAPGRRRRSAGCAPAAPPAAELRRASARARRTPALAWVG